METLLISLVGLNAQQFSTSIPDGLNLGKQGSHTNSCPLNTPGAEQQGFCGRSEEGIKFLSDFHLHDERLFFSPLKLAQLLWQRHGSKMTLFFKYALLKAFLPFIVLSNFHLHFMAAGWGSQGQGDVLHVISIRQLFEILLPAGLQRKTYI